MIILIPMPLLIKSKLPAKRKAVLCGVFALGTFTVCNAANISWSSLEIIHLPSHPGIEESANLRARSFPPFSTKYTVSMIPTEKIGRFGMSANRPPPSSPPTFHMSGHYFDASSTSDHSTIPHQEIHPNRTLNGSSQISVETLAPVTSKTSKIRGSFDQTARNG